MKWYKIKLLIFLLECWRSVTWYYFVLNVFKWTSTRDPYWKQSEEILNSFWILLGLLGVLDNFCSGKCSPNAVYFITELDSYINICWKQSFVLVLTLIYKRSNCLDSNKQNALKGEEKMGRESRNINKWTHFNYR